MSVKAVDEQVADLLAVQEEHRVTLDFHFARELIDLAEKFFNPDDYKAGRNKALDLMQVRGWKREAYKSFIDRVFQRRAQAKLKVRREAFKRPFAPRD